MNLSPLDFQLFIKIKEKPSTGYDIQKVLESSHIWKASHQQIYRNLNKLAKYGFVKIQNLPQIGKPDKKIYTITQLGEEKIHQFTSEFKPGINNLHCAYTVMLNSGNTKYYEKLIKILNKEINKLELLFLNDPLKCNAISNLEWLAIQRKIAIYKAEVLFCYKAIDSFSAL
ncbi:PadR family transcriptional regulator [Photobacterium sp. R1]